MHFDHEYLFVVIAYQNADTTNNDCNRSLFFEICVGAFHTFLITDFMQFDWFIFLWRKNRGEKVEIFSRNFSARKFCQKISLKRSENQRFSDVLRGYRKRPVA